MNRPLEFNTRVLVIDDEDSVRDSFKFALGRATPRSQRLHDAAADLFDDDLPDRLSSPYTEMQLELDTARTGREGYAKVEQAVNEERPYAVLFVDMRMPGWDGLQTVEHIRRIDPRCEIIFVTAYSEQPLDKIVQTVGPNVGYFLKPFASAEVKQMATKAIIDWNKAREMERLLHTVTSLDGEVVNMEKLLGYLLGELCLWMGTDSGALVQMRDGGVHVRAGRGKFNKDDDMTDLAALLAEVVDDQPVVRREWVILPIKEFGFAVIIPGDTVLTPERMFLLRLFIEHASLTIRNSEARRELARTRRLAAVGEALGCVVHDIRGPLGNAQLLIEYLARGDEQLYSTEEAFEMLKRSLIQVEATVNDTLDCVRGTMIVDKREVALAAELHQPLKLIGFGLQRRGITLDVQIPDELRAFVDPLPLVRALRNLATNASEALRSGPNVIARPRIEIGARPAGGGDPDGVRTVIWVADNGPGIPEEVRANLFEAFATSGKSSGTGLGLAVVRLVAEVHGGTVEVLSDDTGTRFELYIP